MRAWDRKGVQLQACTLAGSLLVILATALEAQQTSGQVPEAKALPISDPPTNKAATKSSYTLTTQELKVQYRWQHQKQTGVVSIASVVPSPCSIVITWNPTSGPVPENPLLVQIMFKLNINNEKVPAIYTTTTPVAAQGGQWTVDVTDVVKRLADDINTTLPPNFDPISTSFPLDTAATVKVIQVLKSPAQFGPATINKGPAADVNNDTLKVKPALLLGEPQ